MKSKGWGWMIVIKLNLDIPTDKINSFKKVQIMTAYTSSILFFLPHEHHITIPKTTSA